MVVNPDKPYIQGSSELLIMDKLGFEFGFGKRYSNNWLDGKLDSYVVKFQGASFMFDIRLYNNFLSEKIPDLTGYIGFSYRYIDDLRNIKARHRDIDTSNQNLLEDFCGYQRELHFLTVKMGSIVEYKKFGFDCFLEIGIKHKNQYYVKNELYNAGYSVISYMFEPYPVKGYRPYLGMGFRFSYRIL
jgi:hypothetical protein